MMLWSIYISLISVATCVGLVRFKKLNLQLKIILSLVAWALLIELLRKFGPSSLRNVFTHANLLVEITLYAAYFSTLLKPNKRPIILAGILLFLVALALNSEFLVKDFWFQKRFTYAVAANISITLWSSLYLYELIYKPLHHSLKYDGNFWVNCGNLVFFPGTLFLLGLGNYLQTENPDWASELNIINHSLNLVLYFFILVALYIHAADTNKPKQTLHS